MGRVTKVGEAYVTLEVAHADAKSGTQTIEMQFQKSAIQTLLPNGTLKSL